MPPGFACIHANEDACRGMLAFQIGAKRAADGMKRGIVKGRFAGFAADSVGTEELFGHGVKAVEFHNDRETILR